MTSDGWRAELAALQRGDAGVFSRQAAIELGVPPATIDGRVRSGRYRVLLPGVYAEAGAPDGWTARVTAALRWAGRDAVLSRGSAALLHGLPVPATSTAAIHLLVADRTFEVPSGLVVHRTRHLLRRHLGEVRGLPVTTAARTVCDLAGELDTRDLRRIVAAAARGHLTDATELRRTLRELRRVRGAPRLRPVIDELSPLDAQCRTELETFYLRVARAGGIEPTAMNHRVRDAAGGRRYLDAVYLPEHVWVELDGKGTHSSTLDRNDDTQRTADVRAVGPWREPLRFGWTDLRDRPDGVVAEVRRALVAAGRRPATGPAPA